jgi:SAM-dependent methyltransferase
MLITEEKAIVDRVLKTMRGNCLLQIGGPIDNKLTAHAQTPRVYFVDVRYHARPSQLIIQAHMDQLPVESASIDIVLIAHALEFSDNPWGVLQEAHRVLKPDGRILVLGFNRWSLWHLWKLFLDNKRFPWNGHFYSTGKIKRELCALDFEVELQQTLCFRPPIDDVKIAENLLFLETISQ